MQSLGRYDGCLQMFVHEPRDADLQHLRFLRWLVEHRDLEHGDTGRPGESWCGPKPEYPKACSPVVWDLGTEMETFW